VKAYSPRVRLCIPHYPCFQADLLAWTPYRHAAGRSSTCPPALLKCKADLLSPGNREDVTQAAAWFQVSRQLYSHACAKWKRDFIIFWGFRYLLLSSSSLPPLLVPTRTLLHQQSYHLPVQNCTSYRQTRIRVLQSQYSLGHKSEKVREWFCSGAGY